MSKTGKIIAGVIVVVLGILAIVLANKAPTETGSIKIGYIDPLSGDAANFGSATKGGIEVAIKEINDAGGIGGHLIQMIYEDGKCNGKDAAAAAQKLISIDHVKYIVGLVCSGEVLGVSPISEQNKVFIMVQGSSPEISHAGKYIVRTWPSDLTSSQSIAQHAVANNFKKMAVIIENTDYSTALGYAFNKAYTELGGEVLYSETYSPNTVDFRTALAKIKALKPEAIFIDAQSGGNAARIAAQARELGITAQFYSAFLTGPEFVSSGPAVNGTYLVDLPALNMSRTASTAFTRNYKQINGSDSPYPFVSAASYDQIKLLAMSISKYGYNDTKAIRDFMHTISSYDGVIGSFHFDENGDVAGITLRIVQVVNGKVVDVQ